MLCSPGKVDAARVSFGYWDMLESAAPLRKHYASLPHEAVVRETRRLLEEATRYHLVADVPVGSFLSGGVDSAAVTALMSRESATRVKTFSIGFDHAGEALDESGYAAEVAAALGTEHTAYRLSGDDVAAAWDDVINNMDQPSADGLNTWMVSRAAARDVKAVISGLGGDELFAGYPYFALFASVWDRPAGPLDRLAGWLHSMRPNRFTASRAALAASLRERVVLARRYRSISQLRRLLAPDWHPAVARLDGVPQLPDNAESIGPVTLLSNVEIKGYLLSTLLRDSNCMSMAHSLELRPVLLDHRLVEHALALSDAAKCAGGRFKIALVDAVRDLIPSGCWERPKTGFALPLVHWMNTSLNRRVQDTLSGRTARILLDERKRRGLLARARENRADWHCWSIYTLLSWLESTGCDVSPEVRL